MKTYSVVQTVDGVEQDPRVVTVQAPDEEVPAIVAAALADEAWNAARNGVVLVTISAVEV